MEICRLAGSTGGGSDDRLRVNMVTRIFIVADLFADSSFAGLSLRVLALRIISSN